MDHWITQHHGKLWQTLVPPTAGRADPEVSARSWRGERGLRFCDLRSLPMGKASEFMVISAAKIWGFHIFHGNVIADFMTHRIHGAVIYGNMDPINIPQSC